MISWTTIYYILSWLIYGGFGFILAFLYELAKAGNILQLPKEKQQSILAKCAITAGKWFWFGLSTALGIWITLFLANTLPLYFEMECILLIAGTIFTAILPKHYWEVFLSYFKPLWEYFSKEQKALRSVMTQQRLLEKKAKLQAEIDKLKVNTQRG